MRPAQVEHIGHEIGNALGRLQADRPKLALATDPGNMARLVSMVLTAIDRTCVRRFGLQSLDERRKYLRVSLILRSEGITLAMTSSTGGGRRREWALDRTKRKEELLQIPAVLALVENVVIHANALLTERGLDATHLLPAGKFVGDYCPIDFFGGD